MTKSRTVVLGVTGSIAAYRACEIINLLKKSSVDVHVLLTKEAREFITPLTLQTLSQNKVITDMFELPEEWNPAHTALAEKADLVLIAPATANVIGKLASGVCDDILTSVVFAAASPVLIAPAMNEKMYNHRIVRENIQKLKAIGYKFIGPVKGRLACGHEAIGHISDTADIVNEAKRLLVRRSKSTPNNISGEGGLVRRSRSTPKDISGEGGLVRRSKSTPNNISGEGGFIRRSLPTPNNIFGEGGPK